MKTYSQFVNETFDTRVKWRQSKRRNSIIFTATIDGKEVILNFVTGIVGLTGLDMTGVGFRVDGSFEVTGGGSANKIFGAVINKIAEYVDEHQPEQIGFTAAKHVGETGKEKTSRINLYKRLLTRKFARTDYRTETYESGDQTIFLLTRKD